MLNDESIEIASQYEQPLISPYSRELLQPHSYDCTLDRTLKVAGFSKKSGHRWWDIVTIGESGFLLEPYQFVLASTLESFILPQNFVGFVQGKSSIGRNGLQIENAGLIDAGFRGNITLELFNMAPWPIKLKYSMRICQVHFQLAELPTICNYSLTGHYNNQKGPTESVFNI